jgi:hypothetical protein
MNTPVLTLERYPALPSFQDETYEDEWVALQVCREILQESLRDMRCPTHHGSPSVRIALSRDETPEIRIAGCCDHLIDSAVRFVEETLMQPVETVVDPF